MPSHNQQISNNHLHKDWQSRVKTWFNQPANKARRRAARQRKARMVAPRPVQKLRPLVRPPSVRHNRRLRYGRGFTHEEIKAAGLHRRYARTIGIAVDYRRVNRSQKSLLENTQRLKEYLARLVLAPRHAKKPKPGEATDPAALRRCKQVTGPVLPPRQTARRLEVVKLADIDSSKSAFRILRRARADARLVGIRAKRAKGKAAAKK